MALFTANSLVKKKVVTGKEMQNKPQKWSDEASHSDIKVVSMK